MKIVLLVLGGDPGQAHEYLLSTYSGAWIEEISRVQLESLAPLRRICALHALGPEVFAVATERLGWQQGQNALLLFGALAGAREVIIFDSFEAERRESRGSVLLRVPFRLAHEAWASWQTLRRARRELARLEGEVARTKSDSRSPKGDRHAQPRITYLRTTPAAGTQFGGATTHTVGFINGALESGASVSVISNDQIAGLDESRIPTKLVAPDWLGLTRVAFDLRNGMLFTDRAAAEIEQQRPDLIYQRYSRFNWTGVEASLRTRRPLFLEYNGSEVWMAKHWGRLRQGDLLERCERLNLAAAARIFVVSEVERQNLLHTGVDAEKIVVNPNAVDVDQFKPGSGGTQIRGDLRIAPREILVGFVGTFGPWHGVETLAHAIAQMPRNSDLGFLLIGSGALRGRVEEILREGGAIDRVIMLGAVEHERVPGLLDACDILVSPHVPLEDGSEFFGSPTKLFEYMAMGKAIVASRLGQIAEVLDDQESALLVEPGDARQLADAILRLSNSSELRERLGAAARRAAIEKHTWKQNAGVVLGAYRGLIEN